jgi:hypothetical protein
MAGEAVGAGGADLAVVDGFRVGGGVGGRLTMREIHLKFRVECVRAVREHARQISMEMRQFPE